MHIFLFTDKVRKQPVVKKKKASALADPVQTDTILITP